MLSTPRAAALYSLIADFVTSPAFHFLSLAHQREAQGMQDETLRHAVSGPDLSRDRDAQIRTRLRLLGVANVPEAA